MKFSMSAIIADNKGGIIRLKVIWAGRLGKDYLKMKRFPICDIHTHGLGHVDTQTVKAEDILELAGLHVKSGTSWIIPAVYPAAIEVMRKNMSAIREAMETDRAKTIKGINLEGPFLNPLRCGALRKDAFLKPSLSSLKKLTKGFEGIIKIITIAPELPGSLSLIRRCADMGITVSMGHSDATYSEALEGKKAGSKGVTHIFNAMRPFHHREPGLSGLGLLDEDLYIEVIADGAHLSAETIKMIFKIKKPDRIILVSDSVKGAQYKKGILQGGVMPLPGAADFLRKTGIPKKWISMALSDNPRRYLMI
jgi:N-acetylglucosamine-6-phosphate deacetylase